MLAVIGRFASLAAPVVKGGELPTHVSPPQQLPLVRRHCVAASLPSLRAFEILPRGFPGRQMKWILNRAKFDAKFILICMAISRRIH